MVGINKVVYFISSDARERRKVWVYLKLINCWLKFIICIIVYSNPLYFDRVLI